MGYQFRNLEAGAKAPASTAKKELTIVPNSDFFIILPIGKTTYKVNIFQSESAKKPLESTFRELCIKEALDDFLDAREMSLEKTRKIS